MIQTCTRILSRSLGCLCSALGLSTQPLGRVFLIRSSRGSAQISLKYRKTLLLRLSLLAFSNTLGRRVPFSRFAMGYSAFVRSFLTATLSSLSICTVSYLSYYIFDRFSLKKSGNDLPSQVVSNQVLSALKGLTSVFGMGTGGTPSPSSPEMFECIKLLPTHSQLHNSLKIYPKISYSSFLCIYLGSILCCFQLLNKPSTY